MKLIDFSAFCFSTQTIHLRDAWLCITRLDCKYALLHDLDGFYVSTVITCGNNIMCFLFWYEFSILFALATYAQIDWCLPFQAISHAREAIRSANRTCDALEDPIKRVEPAHVKFVWPTFTKGGLKYLMNCFVFLSSVDRKFDLEHLQMTSEHWRWSCDTFTVRLTMFKFLVGRRVHRSIKRANFRNSFSFICVNGIISLILHHQQQAARINFSFSKPFV